VGNVPQLGNWDPSNAVRVRVRTRTAKATDDRLPHVDPTGPGLSSRVGRDGVLSPEHTLPVQIHSQNIQHQRKFFLIIPLASV
jgi:hypothetical protein